MNNSLQKILNKINKKFIIKYIVWDFDGTLYESSSLVKNLEKAYFDYINEYKKINKKDFKNLLTNLKKFSLVASKYLNKSEKEIINKVDSKFKSSPFIKKNKKIVKWIEGMTQYKHLILSNSELKNIEKGLLKIGFKKKNKKIHPFLAILGRNNIKKIKPHPEAFLAVKKITKAPGFRHLVIGDSWKDDVDAAKKSGMQSIHVNQAKDFFS